MSNDLAIAALADVIQKTRREIRFDPGMPEAEREAMYTAVAMIVGNLHDALDRTGADSLLFGAALAGKAGA